MHKIVISGGPSTGKSTTFDMLRGSYCDAHPVVEAAELIIKDEQAKHKIDPTYEPVLPVTNYRKFVPLVLETQRILEANIPDGTEMAFLDRSFIDNLGYLAHHGLEEFVPEVEKHIKAACYTLAFFCDWLDNFEQTEIRHETPEVGLAIHRQLETAYHAADIPVVHLPKVSPEERLVIIKETLAEL